jgi:hypothetical protein
VRGLARAAARAGPETETEGSPLDFPEARGTARRAGSFALQTRAACAGRPLPRAVSRPQPPA